MEPVHSSNSASPQSSRMRDDFHTFVDDDAMYKHFVQTCNTTSREKERLTFQQEKLWQSFVDTHDEYAGLCFRDIIDAFYVCHVHGLPLSRGEVPICKDVWDFTRAKDIEAQVSQNAPYSASFVPDSPAWGDATHVTVDQCAECLKTRNQIEERQVGLVSPVPPDSSGASDL